jgi:hypothetical protein
VAAADTTAQQQCLRVPDVPTLPNGSGGGFDAPLTIPLWVPPFPALHSALPPLSEMQWNPIQ